ncbi:MAG: uroporphyrinogen decarboxylase family protein [Bacteroidetes bacterium]|nr:uroporphyrinogen decarboxylase family protein [Bacteroidota bacterium]MBU1114673.1 uroporphyrinogen decarboxylase family protein [Bacteroidota bacterium]MBU1798987.1 uroporphyrinogen decarboxylase family protein [Bacteroidota bacterium]
MITGMDRLIAAVNGEKSDRIPVFCNMFDQGAKELGMSLKEYYSKGEYVAEGQLKMREKYGYDNLWSLFYVGKEVELMGCGNIIYSDYGPPNVGQMVIRKPEDIHKLEIPDDILSHPKFEESLKCLRILKKESDGKYPICAYITSSMTLPAMLMGMSKWMELLLMGPEELRDELLAKCNDFFIKEVAAYRKEGADVLFYANFFGSTDAVPMKYFMDQSLPWIEKDISSIGTKDIVYFCAQARFNNVLDILLKRTGIRSYYLSPLDDVAEGKRIIAGRGLICGSINDIKLIDWSKEEIRNEVKRIIDAGMPGGKFLFTTAVMPLAIPEENIKIMLEAAYEFGSYEK